MERTFKINTTLLPLEHLALLFFGGIFFISGICIIMAYSLGNISVFYYYLRLLLDITIIGVLAFSIHTILLRDMSKTLYIFNGDCFTKRTLYRISSIFWNQIKDIKFIGIFFVFGVFSISSNTQRIYVSLRANEIHQLLLLLKENILEFMPEHVKLERKLNYYIRVTKKFEESILRINRIIPYLWLINIVLCLINVCTTIFLWRFSFYSAFVWSLFCLFLFLLGIIIGEAYILTFKKENKSNEFEFNVYFIVWLLFFIIYLACGILFKWLLSK